MLYSFIELPWPALSADVFLIEHLWDVLDKAVRKRPEETRNLQELWLSNRNGMMFQFTLFVVWLDRREDIAAQSLMRQVDTRDTENMIKCDFENQMWLCLTGCILYLLSLFSSFEHTTKQLLIMWYNVHNIIYLFTFVE